MRDFDESEIERLIVAEFVSKNKHDQLLNRKSSDKKKYMISLLEFVALVQAMKLKGDRSFN
jgi:hypothetical protein